MKFLPPLVNQVLFPSYFFSIIIESALNILRHTFIIKLRENITQHERKKQKFLLLNLRIRVFSIIESFNKNLF